MANEKTRLIERPETPLPWIKVGLVGLILFCNTFSLVLVFPFLPFMTHDFFPDLPKRELGYKAGYLGSAFSSGSLCAAYIWGKLADRYGRKPVLLSGLLGTLGSIVAFGCSKSFEQALITRFLWGLLNGNIGVAKTVLAEVLDDTNMSRGFAIIGLQAGIGRLVGPALGGILSSPAERYPMLDFPLLRMYPYLLPCLIAAGLAFIGFLGTLAFLEETLNVTPPTQVDLDGYEGEDPASPAVRYSPKVSTKSDRSTTVWDLLRNPKIRLSTSLYGLIAFIGIMSNEVLPLWFLNAPVDGGFNFSTAEIGFVFSISAPFEVLYQVYAFPKLARRFGSIKFLRLALLALGAMIFLLPFTSIVATAPTMLKWTVLCAAVCLTVLCRLTCFTNVFVLINNSTTTAFRARVNGIGQTMAAAARIISPALCATLYAWSESDGFAFPLNFHFVFVVTSLLTIGTFLLSTKLPASCGKPARE